MYTILPFLLIILSMTTIVIVLVRKFPQLALLDIEDVPEIKSEKKKTEFLKKKVERKANDTKKERLARLKPFVQQLKNIQLIFRKYVGRVEKTVVKETQKKIEAEQPKKKIQRKTKVGMLLSKANHFLDEEQFESAEKKYLEIIRLDAKNIDAYRGLAEVYELQGNIEEAKETLDYVLHLDSSDDKTMVRLAEIYTGKGAVDKAVKYYEKAILIDDGNAKRFAKLGQLLMKIDQYESAYKAFGSALELEPQNPKYLDIFLEIIIMLGMRQKSKKIYEQLRLVNPGNKKLEIFKEKIDALI
jgi:Tfp pilus assembly protein PilF